MASSAPAPAAASASASASSAGGAGGAGGGAGAGSSSMGSAAAASNAPAGVTSLDNGEVVLFYAPCKVGHVAVTQVAYSDYGTKKLRHRDMDTVNDDGDYDSDDVVESSWCTAKRRLRFFVDPAASSAKGGKSKAAADAKTGAGAAASSSVSDFVQTEMLVHVRATQECLTTSTWDFMEKHSVLVRSYLCFQYHRLFIVGLAMSAEPSVFFPCYSRKAQAYQEDHVEVKDVLVLGLGGGALPQFLLSVTRKRRMCITAVEHDPGVVAVARHYFGLIPSRKMGIHVRDAKSFLQAAEEEEALWDAIVVDTDSAGATQGSLAAPAEEMCTLPFLQLVERCLMVKGVAMFNVLYDGRGADSSADSQDAQKAAKAGAKGGALSPAAARFLARFVILCGQAFTGVAVLYTIDGPPNRVVVAWNYPAQHAVRTTLPANVDGTGGTRPIETVSSTELTRRLRLLLYERPLVTEPVKRAKIGLQPIHDVMRAAGIAVD